MEEHNISLSNKGLEMSLNDFEIYLFKCKNENKFNNNNKKEYKPFNEENKKINIEHIIMPINKDKLNENKVYKNNIANYLQRKAMDNGLNISINIFRPKKEINNKIRSFSAEIRKLKVDIKNKNIFEPPKAIYKESSPGIIGLLNKGGTCYMNATLQCFSNIKELRTKLLNEILYQELEKNKNTTKKLSFSLAEVLILYNNYINEYI